jgi:hypothetical protein
VPRWNGSVFYPTKVPDLIGLKDRKYLDATATHLHRGIGDLMRYAALVSSACARCHTPPLYTSNKLTLARGFAPPPAVPATLDILRISVGTDPGLALKTRKGTGYYKVPSLKGVWYRGHFLHDGSAASLEEMFDPGRLEQSHVPGGLDASRHENSCDSGPRIRAACAAGGAGTTLGVPTNLVAVRAEPIEPSGSD